MRFSILATLFAAIVPGLALPSPLEARDVPSDELIQFKLWVQYAAASYCEANYAGQVGAKLGCWAGNCPQVEAADTKIVYDFSNTTATDTAGYIAVDNTNKAVILAFRGSYSVRNWIADVEFPYTDPGLCDGCEAEFGFWSSWAVVRDDIMKNLNEVVSANSDYELIVVGHSLGAGVATLAAADIRGRGHPSAKLYAYASPRVANPALAKFITDQNNNYRFTHTNDPVPKLPLIAMGYVHVSPEYYITSGNNVTVTTGDIQVLDGEVNVQGNTGTGVPTIEAFSAHHWYFERADGCIGPGIPWKRSY
ncbi:hypothetical protein N7523_000337 [Penicillium sp. IBT 18751x]|nr:hypothetical protein N7523_000337 [Penicillium sp. IBT 18751x]